MTGTCCCVVGCRNNSKSSKNLSWHSFPRDPKLRRMWIQAINRAGRYAYSEWKPKNHHRVCGIHFHASGKKQKLNTIPKYYLSTSVATLDHKEQKQSIRQERISLDNLDIAAEVTIPIRSAALQLHGKTSNVTVKKRKHQNASGDHPYCFIGDEHERRSSLLSTIAAMTQTIESQRQKITLLTEQVCYNNHLRHIVTHGLVGKGETTRSRVVKNQTCSFSPHERKTKSV